MLFNSPTKLVFMADSLFPPQHPLSSPNNFKSLLSVVFKNKQAKEQKETKTCFNTAAFLPQSRWYLSPCYLHLCIKVSCQFIISLKNSLVLPFSWTFWVLLALFPQPSCSVKGLGFTSQAMPHPCCASATGTVGNQQGNQGKSSSHFFIGEALQESSRIQEARGTEVQDTTGCICDRGTEHKRIIFHRKERKILLQSGNEPEAVHFYS